MINAFETVRYSDYWEVYDWPLCRPYIYEGECMAEAFEIIVKSPPVFGRFWAQKPPLWLATIAECFGKFLYKKTSVENKNIFFHRAQKVWCFFLCIVDTQSHKILPVINCLREHMIYCPRTHIITKYCLRYITRKNIHTNAETYYIPVNLFLIPLRIAIHHSTHKINRRGYFRKSICTCAKLKNTSDQIYRHRNEHCSCGIAF